VIVTTTKTLRPLVFLALAVSIASCAGYRNEKRAQDAIKAENWDAAVYHLLEALARDPGDFRLKMDLQRARLRAGNIHFQQGMSFKKANELQRARAELELAVQLDPTHQYAEVELAKVRKDLEIAAQEGGLAKLEAMKKAAGEMKVKPPALNPASNEPLSLSFPNQTNVKDIYKAVGQAFGINILFDPKLKDSKIALELKNVTARQALETVMQAAGHFYKVLDEKSLIVVEDSPQNRRDYEDLVVKTFFLSSADVKDVNNMLRSLIDARRVAVNEQLNSIVIRDTADKVAIAERLIAANDKSKAEVLVDVELIQVDSNKLRDIGTSLSSYTFPITLDPSSITGSATNSRIPLDQLGDITRSMWGMVVPNVTISLVKSAGEAETLAQPELRITEGEKASLVIGDRVPIPTTTFNTTQTIGGNIVPITAFQYQDVGIKLELEPRVHHNNEITLKLKVEVSQLGDKVEIGPGQSQYKIGNRTIDSVIRLKDGETSLLAGLYKHDKQTSRQGLPWISDLPVIGPLFRSNYLKYNQTDLVLTITPHIIRNPDITEEDLAPLWVGTENRITVSGTSPAIRSSASSGPFGEPGQPQPLAGPEDEPEASEEPEEAEKEERRLTFPSLPQKQPKTTAPTGPGIGLPGSPPKPTKNPDDSASSTGEEGLASLTFYPTRLPVAVGSQAELTIVLDPGAGGASGPLHFAYDPQRLEVTRVDGGDLPNGGRNSRVEVTHTPALGWITTSWDGTATGSGTLLRLAVRPRVAGELPVIFAGPVGAVTSKQAVVVALPDGPTLRTEAKPE
jgi:general secretion pathway protein D